MVKKMCIKTMLLAVVLALSSCTQNVQSTPEHNSNQEEATSSAQTVISVSKPQGNEHSEINGQPTSGGESAVYDDNNVVELKLENAAMVLNVSDMDFLEHDGKIVMAANLSGNNTGAWIELFDAASGNSLHHAHYEESYTSETLQIASSLEGDVAFIVGDHQMYLNVFDPTIEHPSTPSRSINDSNDYEIISWTSSMYPWEVGGWHFTSTGEGITASPHVAVDAFPFTVSAEEIRNHDELPIMNLEAPVYFDNLRLMNDGTVLVANIVSASGQLGSVGVFAINIYTGEQHWFTDMFEVMGGELDYINDYELGVIGMENLHRVSLVTGEHEISDLPEAEYRPYASYDYESFVYLLPGENESIVHLGNPSNPLYVNHSEDLYPIDMTENYVFMIDFFKGTRTIQIAPWRDNIAG